MSDPTRPIDPDSPLARREFLARVATLSALAAAGSGVAPRVLAQAAKPLVDPAGTVPNEVVLGAKMQGFAPHSARPLTWSTTAEYQDFDVTPNDRMFIRNNLLTPDLDAANHMLRVRGLVDRPLDIPLAELKKMPSFTTQGMVECAGSGRVGFQPPASGTRWQPTGGMGCPAWTGVSLADVLKRAGVKAGAVHVAFSGDDVGAVPTAPKVIRSIPMAKAMERHTMIVWAMNGGDLPKIHGYPLRMVVPGWVGSASTKWLSGIEVLDAPFKGTYMDDSYRIPNPPVPPGSKLPPGSPITEAWPVKSMITLPGQGDRYKAGGLLVVRGSAWAGDYDIERVDISLDNGATWQPANLTPRAHRYAWRRFRLEVPLTRAGELTILARATDEKGNTQPVTSTWNPLGYFWNSIHRVGIVVDKA
jgi:DMSO/TMAO reductase YedYZ molybdopterin-dependent catalytic subunit